MLQNLIPHLKNIIFSFLKFSDYKSLIKVCKRISYETKKYLCEFQKKLPTSVSLKLNEKELISILKTFRRIEQINLITFQFHLDKISEHFPINLRTLSLIDSSDCFMGNVDFFENLKQRACFLTELKIEFVDYKTMSPTFVNNKVVSRIHLQLLLDKLPIKVLKFQRRFDPDYSCEKILSNFDLQNKFFEAVLLSNNQIETLQIDTVYIDKVDFIETNSDFIKQKYLKNLIIYKKTSPTSTQNKFFPGLNNYTLDYICNLFENLEKLEIIDNTFDSKEKEITNAYLDNLPLSCPNLTKINLNSYMSSSSIEEISLLNLMCNVNELIDFGIASCKIVKNSLISQLVQFNDSIRNLNLDYTSIDDMSLQLLAGICGNLEIFSIQYCKRISCECLVDFFSYNFENLKSLNIRGLNSFTTKCIKNLVQTSKKLEDFKSHQNCISDKGIFILLEACTKLKILELSKNDKFKKKFTKSFLKPFINLDKKFLQMKKLDIGYNNSFECEIIKDICFCFPNLKELKLNGCNKLTDEMFWIMYISNLKNTLKIISAKNINFKSSFIEIIPIILKFYQLEKIYLYSNNFSESNLNQIFHMKNKSSQILLMHFDDQNIKI